MTELQRKEYDRGRAYATTWADTEGYDTPQRDAWRATADAKLAAGLVLHYYYHLGVADGLAELALQRARTQVRIIIDGNAAREVRLSEEELRHPLVVAYLGRHAIVNTAYEALRSAREDHAGQREINRLRRAFNVEVAETCRQGTAIRAAGLGQW